MVRISAAMMGLEICYAAMTAYVSPILLNIGLQHQQMTMVWSLSSIVGIFLTPLLGSLSDKCKHKMGRRRPFIILFSVGVIFGKYKILTHIEKYNS